MLLIIQIKADYKAKWMTVCQAPQQCVIQQIVFEQAPMQALHTSQTMSMLCKKYSLQSTIFLIKIHVPVNSCELLRVFRSTT